MFKEAPSPTKAAKAKTPEESQAEPSPSESTKVYTLYFSGRSPGEYTTRLTTVTVGEGSESPSRKKRHAAAETEEESIEPTRVRPILMTAPPSHKQARGSHNYSQEFPALQYIICICIELSFLKMGFVYEPKMVV